MKAEPNGSPTLETMPKTMLSPVPPAAAALLWLLITACGGSRAAAPAGEAPAPTEPGPDASLVELLDTDVLSAERESRIRGRDSTADPLPRRLNQIARDPDAPPYARGNALLLLGEFEAIGYLGAFALGLRAEDARVRAAAATGLESLVALEPDRVLPILRRALRDEEPWVQARALQSLGAVDPDALRRYVPTAPTEELRQIARSLLQVAEERGAPLSPAMASGEAIPDTLARVSALGRRVRFITEKRWPAWGLAAGRLEVAPPDGEFAEVAGAVEVVAGVVPAFLSPDERWLVYETAREIRVRDLRSGADRIVGPGVAPRVIPFSSSFVFLRATDEAPSGRDETRLTYEVYRASLEGGAPESLGSLTATLSRQRFGNASPVRWMRVVEVSGEFFLEGERMDRFALPSPFGDPAAAP